MIDSRPDPERQLFIYDGTIGDLYSIFLVNLLLKIVTFGIFGFWGITRYRRYLWSHTRCKGERFEYTGTGGELFRGFLLALLVVGGLFVAAGILAAILGAVAKPLAVLPILLAWLALIVLGAGAVFSAQRYRLSRTLWCGIRGGMTGSMLAYGLRAVLYQLLAVCTLFQLTPWRDMRLAEHRINASSFGNAAFRCRGSAGRIYWAFLLTFIANTALLVIIAMFAWIAFQPFLPVLLTAMHGAKNPPATPAPQLISWIFIAAVLLFRLVSALVRTIYQAALYRQFANNSTLGGTLALGTDLGGGALFGFTLANLLITVCTLGFGYPIVLHRQAAFLARHLQATGSLADLAQSPLPQSRRGEGLFELLDAGGVV